MTPVPVASFRFDWREWKLPIFVLFVMIVFLAGVYVGFVSNPKALLYDQYLNIIMQFRQCSGAPYVFCG